MLCFITSKDRRGRLDDIMAGSDHPITAIVPEDPDTPLKTMLDRNFAAFDGVVVDMVSFAGYEDTATLRQALAGCQKCNSAKVVVLWTLADVTPEWVLWLQEQDIPLVNAEDPQNEQQLFLLRAIDGVIDGVETEVTAEIPVEDDDIEEEKEIGQEATKEKRQRKAKKKRQKKTPDFFPLRGENITINVAGVYPHIGVTYFSVSLFLFLCKQGASALLIVPGIDLDALSDDVVGLIDDDQGRRYRNGLIVNDLAGIVYDDYDFVIFDRGSAATKVFAGDVDVWIAGVKSWELPYLDIAASMREEINDIHLVFAEVDETKKTALKARYDGFKSVSFMERSTRLSAGTPNGDIFYDILQPDYMLVPERSSVFAGLLKKIKGGNKK